MKHSFTKEEIAKYFHLPLEEAAKELGVCASVLKRSCRHNGIQRWPYRKIRSLQKKSSILQSAAQTTSSQFSKLQSQIVELEKQKHEFVRLAEEAGATAGSVSGSGSGSSSAGNPLASLISSLQPGSLSDTLAMLSGSGIDLSKLPFSAEQLEAVLDTSNPEARSMLANLAKGLPSNISGILPMMGTSPHESILAERNKGLLEFFNRVHAMVCLTNCEMEFIWIGQGLWPYFHEVFGDNIIGRKCFDLPGIKGSELEMFLKQVMDRRPPFVDLDMAVPDLHKSSANVWMIKAHARTINSPSLSVCVRLNENRMYMEPHLEPQGYLWFVNITKRMPDNASAAENNSNNTSNNNNNTSTSSGDAEGGSNNNNAGDAAGVSLPFSFDMATSKTLQKQKAPATKQAKKDTDSFDGSDSSDADVDLPLAKAKAPLAKTKAPQAQSKQGTTTTTPKASPATTTAAATSSTTPISEPATTTVPATTSAPTSTTPGTPTQTPATPTSAPTNTPNNNNKNNTTDSAKKKKQVRKTPAKAGAESGL